MSCVCQLSIKNNDDDDDGNICILSTTTQTHFITNCLVNIVHTKPVSPKNWLPWQRPFDTQSRLCLHWIAWRRKPTPSIKLHVAGYHTTKVIAHQTSKPVIANCIPKLVAMATMDPHPRHDSYDPSEPTTQMASLSVEPSLHRRP